MRAGNVRILVHMVDARRIERRRAALDAVHNIALAQQEFRLVYRGWQSLYDITNVCDF
jgi:hypothetical protein